MVASFGPDWEQNLPVSQKLSLEDMYMTGALNTHSRLLQAMATGDPDAVYASFAEVKKELEDFQQSYMSRYTDAGLAASNGGDDAGT